MQIGDTVKDLTGDFDIGTIIDIYTNRMDDVPVVVFVVVFGDDKVFDRYAHEIKRT